ncbi:MAG: PSP1 domain-containing protein, partial [Planctomycetales bacterium]
EAIARCEQRLDELGLPVALMDVEQLFDGQTLVFYFLGDESELLRSVVDELAQEYDGAAQLQQFADALHDGCGPACGTDEAENGCGSCSGGCPAASVCAVKH